MNTHIIQKIENCLYCLLYSVVSVCCSQAVALRKGGGGLGTVVATQPVLGGAGRGEKTGSYFSVASLLQ